jgi:predicted DCC family thiol-disulfide oxidoreductase YuxK
MSPKYLIFYDSDCAFCGFWVQRILRRDLRAEFAFAPLSLLSEQAIVSQTIMFVDQHQVLERSDAVLAILEKLSGRKTAWIFGLAVHIPRIFRDSIYNLVARYRRWFNWGPGVCHWPSPVERQRFYFSLQAPEIKSLTSQLPKDWVKA